MRVRVMLSIITLYFISYLIFIFPFDVLSTWLGNPTSLLEVFITTTFVFSLCIYYFRSKTTNKFIKIFVYEGFGIGTVSFFLILPLIAFDYLKIVSSYELAIFFFFIQIPTIIYGYINSRKIKIKNLILKSEKLDKSLKFVFISDVHIGSNHPSSLKKIVSEIIKLNPSFIVIGGDLIDSSSFKIQDLKELKKLKQPIYFVTGNHEYYIKNSKKHLDDLNSVGIETLNNESLKTNGINLIGISDNISDKLKISNFEKLFNKDLFNILIVHKPSIWKKVSTKVNLMLSGHTHNGQIFPFNLIVKLQFPEIYGLYRRMNNHLYVSSGSATWGPKIRIGSNNEIIQIELKN